MTYKQTHPSVFMILIIPFGVMEGYVSVTIAFLFTKAGTRLLSAEFL